MRLLCLALMTMLGVSWAAPQPSVGFDAGSHFRKEEKTGDGKTLGEYGFRTPDGCMHVVRYEADRRGGYRVLGSSKRDCKIKTQNRPFTTTKRPTTTTTTTTTTPATTTTTTTTSTTTTTTTTTTPKSLLISPLPQINNAIEEPLGRQLNQPRAENEPEPLYSYGYKTDTHGHTETGLPDGSKKGEYYWDSPDGWRIIVTYEANERGFYPRVRRIRLTPTTPAPPGGGGDPLAKELLGPDQPEEIAIPAGGCPYYFYYNTRINYHWEHCHEDHNRTGEFGHLGSDGYSHKTSYYADGTGFHPKVSRTPLTARQAETVAEYTNRAFIIPKPDEERQDTERRIQEWLSENRDRVDNPLR